MRYCIERRRWIFRCSQADCKMQSRRRTALLTIHTKKRYSKPLKQEVTHVYLAGEGSYSELSARYNIPFLILSESGVCSIMIAVLLEALKREKLRS